MRHINIVLSYSPSPSESSHSVCVCARMHECAWVCMCACMSVHECAWVCACMSVHECAWVCMCACMSVHECAWVCMCACMSVHECACAWVCMSVRVRVHECAWVCMCACMSVHVRVHACEHVCVSEAAPYLWNVRTVLWDFRFIFVTWFPLSCCSQKTWGRLQRHEPSEQLMTPCFLAPCVTIRGLWSADDTMFPGSVCDKLRPVSSWHHVCWFCVWQIEACEQLMTPCFLDPCVTNWA